MLAAAAVRWAVSPTLVKTPTPSGHGLAAVFIAELVFTFALTYVMLNVATSKDHPNNSDKGKYVGWKPATYDTADSYCRTHILLALGAVKLSGLNVGLLDDFLRTKVGTVSESTRDHIRSILYQICECEWATGRDIILKNYAKYTAPITVPKYEPTVPAPGQARRLLDAA
jgi:hypothetical protein